MRQTSTKKWTTAQSPTPQNRFETSLAQTTLPKKDFNQKVQEKAYELFVARGYAHGYDVEDWYQAERIVKGA